MFLYKKFEDNEIFKNVSDMRKRSMRKIAEITKCIVYERYSSVFKLLKRTFKALRLCRRRLECMVCNLFVGRVSLRLKPILFEHYREYPKRVDYNRFKNRLFSWQL